MEIHPKRTCPGYVEGSSFFRERREKKTKGRNTGSNSCIVIQSASTFRREMKSSTLYLTLFLIIFFVLVVNIDAAAVGKGGGVGGGGRSAKGKFVSLNLMKLHLN